MDNTTHKALDMTQKPLEKNKEMKVNLKAGH